MIATLISLLIATAPIDSLAGAIPHSVEPMLPPGPNWTLPERPRATRRCGLHNARMRVVSVSIAYGLVFMENGYWDALERFPNGEPWESGGCVVYDDSPMKTWAYRCERCVQAWNEWNNHGSWTLQFHRAPGDWVEFRVGGDVVFRAPAGLSVKLWGNNSVANGRWSGDGMEIRARYAEWNYADCIDSGDINGDVLINDTFASVSVMKMVAGGWCLCAEFAAPPVGERQLALSVEVPDEESLESACSVLGSVRFTGER